MTPQKFANAARAANEKHLKEQQKFQSKMRGCPFMDGYICKPTKKVCEPDNCPFQFHSQNWWLHEYGPIKGVQTRKETGGP